MRLLSITSLALGLACELTLATSLLDNPLNVYRRKEPLDEHVRREASDFVDTQFDTRQEISHNAAPAPSASAPSAGPPANLNDPSINSTVATACLHALSDITHVDNAAGWAACYNILYLNNQTGIFEADLRLYQVSQPSGAFAGVHPSNIHLALDYPEASINKTSQSQQAKREELATRQSGSVMSQYQQYALVGEIDQRLTLSQLKAADLMALVIPTISLYAQAPQTEALVSTNMTSASIAFFATGVFAGHGASAAAASFNSALALAVLRGAAFTLPGKTIAIFPVGGIVTGVWIILFVTAFGLGTAGRIASRKQYRAHKSTAAPTTIVPAANSDGVPAPPPLRRLLSRKVSNSKRPKADAAPARKDSKSKKNPPLESVVEMVNYEITYDKTFGERPNYYLEHLPSYRTTNRQF